VEEYLLKAFAIGSLIACLASLQASAYCNAPPEPPQLPDGASASREDMVSAVHAIRTYETAVKEYQDCAQRTKDEVQMQNADRVAAKLTAIAEKFNAELYVFKKKNGT
jgi:hypothetical protein